MLDRRGKTRFALLMLFVFLSAGPPLYGRHPQDTFIYEIRFGLIEPPVVAQQDVTVRAPVSNQQNDLEPLECSGLAWFDGHLLITSDRHQHLLFTCPVDLKTLTFGAPAPQVIIHNELDLLNDTESITLLQANGQTSLYMMCSLSNAPNGQPLPQRRELFGGRIKQISPFQFDQGNVLGVGILRRQLEKTFETIHARPYYAYNADYPGEDKNTYRWGNVEGITFTPDGQTLLCGMRNPLFDDAAVLFAVSDVPRAVNSLQVDVLLKVTDVFLLDLDRRGISELCWDPVTKGYLITAAKSNGPRTDPDSPYPPNTLNSALFWWSGQKSDYPILIALFPDMTIEAVCRLGNSPYIALGSDEGDVSEGRTARQSIVTVMEFTGIPPKLNL